MARGMASLNLVPVLMGRGVWPPVDWHARAWTSANPYERDMAGKALAGPYFGCVYSLTGDLEHFAKALQLRHFNANHMCDLCPANRDEGDRSMLYNNFGRDARWKLQCYSAHEWRSLYQVRNRFFTFDIQRCGRQQFILGAG